MNLGVSYNFFNGEEHLIQSIKCIRNEVDHLNIVYQEISNKGMPLSNDARDVLSFLKKEKLVDEFYCYEPDLQLKPQINELNKRRIGLEIAKKHSMSHFMTMDADEFYRSNEFKFAKEFIDNNNVLNSTVRSYMHIKSPNWRALDSTLVPFIFKITDKVTVKRRYFVKNVDPTRKFIAKASLIQSLFYKKHHIFPIDQIAMFHMNLVRKDMLISKFKNSSTNNLVFFEKLQNEFLNWDIKKGFFCFPGKGIIQPFYVENEFGVWSPDEGK